MEKNLIIKSLENLTTELETQFNTTILRKIFMQNSSVLFRSISPIDKSILTDKANNSFGLSFPKTKLFNDSSLTVLCGLFIPINDGYIIDNNLQSDRVTFQNIIQYCTNILGLKVYDGGEIKMSYGVPVGMDSEHMFSTSDTLITKDLCEELGSVSYRRILYYI